MQIAQLLPLNYNSLKQAVFSQLCSCAITLPLKHHENPIIQFQNL